MISETKQCYCCREIKPITEFCFDNRANSRLGAWCRICSTRKAWERRLHRCYNLTINQYKLLLKSQNGVCVICKQFETKIGRGGKIQPLSVDHDHKTNRVRNLLCHSCNNVIGFAKDKPEILRRAADYLEKHK